MAEQKFDPPANLTSPEIKVIVFHYPTIPLSIITDIQHLPSSEKDESYNWIFTNPDKQGKLSYRAGFDWQSAGDITGSLSCHTYLDSLIIR